MKTNLRWTAALLILVLGLAGPALAADKAAPQNLSGTWKLNEDMTARMMESLRKEQGEGHGGPPGGPRESGRPGGGPPGGSRGEKGGPGMGRPPGPPPSLEHLDELKIEQSGDTLTLTDKTGRQRVFRTDGRKVHDGKGPHGPEDVKASWGDQGGLIVEVKAEEGPKRTEVYQISNDGKRLFLTISLEGGPQGRKMRRVYDRS